MKKSQELAKQEFEKRQRISALSQKADATDADVAEVKSLIAECKQLETDVKAAQELEAATDENEIRMKALQETPVGQPMVFPGGKAVGETVLQTREVGAKGDIDLSVLYEEGELGITPEQRRAISTKEYHGAIRKYVRAKRDGEITQNEWKTLQEGADGSGGFLVPEDIQSRVIQRAPTPTRVSGMVTRLQTSRDAMVFPKVNYTGASDDSTGTLYTTGIRVKNTGEVPSSSTAHRVVDPAFSQVRIPIHTAMMSLLVTNDQVEDTSFGLVAWIADKFRETVDLHYDNKIINGSGIGEPAGILLNPGAADQPAIVNSGDAAKVTADGLISLAYSVPEQYDENCQSILKKTTTARDVALLKDADNRYLFARGITDDGLAVSRPATLVGYPFAYSGFMPDPAANAFPIIFGDMRGYYFVERIGFSIQVLREVYAELNSQLILGRIRIGGQVAENWRIFVQRCHT